MGKVTNKQLPFLKFWPMDFFTSKRVRKLDDLPGCAMAYLGLLMLMWMDGGDVEDDTRDLADQLQIEESDWQAYRDRLVADGLVDEIADGNGVLRLSQARLSEDFASATKTAKVVDEVLAKGRAKANARKQAKSKKPQEKSAAPQGPVTGTSDTPPVQAPSTVEHKHKHQHEQKKEEPSPERSVAVERGFGGEKIATDKKATPDQAHRPKTLSDIANLGLDD